MRDAVAGVIAALLVPWSAALADVPPDNPHGSFEGQCGTCHSPETWKPARVGPDFDHSKYGYDLEGAHEATPCLLCHLTLEFTSVRGTECSECHDDVHAGELGSDCADCHGTRTFVDRGEEILRHRTSRFPLTGAHATVDCESCHGGEGGTAMRFANTPMECAACHLETFRATRNPDHVAAGFPTDCAQCHSSSGWSGQDFDHSLTSFPLTGAHRAVDCQSCHAGLQFTGTANDCFSCHAAAYDATTDPAHAAGGFSTDCAACHGTDGWSGAEFDHDATAFALTGAHTAAACFDCHGDGVYAGKDPACVACHLSDYQAAATPNHVASGFPTDCVSCHGTSAWTGATFDHDATAFPLTGAHNAAACFDCHGDGVYSGKDPACAACHLSDYQATTDPAHVAAGFPTDCAACHGTSGWTGAVFNHSQTQFPLTGAHTGATCFDCHGDGVYAGKDPACVACHLSDYQATTTPDHVASAFPTDCIACHGTFTWTGATFDHNATAFPLTGAHNAVSCVDCHGDGVYAGKDPACVSCHLSEYQSTTDPDHVAAAFPTDCASCHGTSVWTGATFDHAQTAFPLTGAHTGATCFDCHGDGVYAGKDPACVACHLSDYQATSNPDHLAAGFPTDCASCHGTNGWLGATFNHDSNWFPIYTGRHSGVWGSDCTTCHVQPTDYTAFECILCHEHNEAQAGSHHSGVPGYSWNSSACYRCHPRGTG